MKKIIIPDQEYLNSLLIYKDEFGSLHWKSQPGKRCNNTKDRAGCYNSKDYRVIRIDSKLYHEHRIIWVMQNGSIPEGYDIDHIDRNKVNNRINNLRLLNRSLNIINQNSKGVSYDKERNKWKAQLTYKGKQIINKRFNTEEEALFAYQEAKNILFQTLNYSKDPGHPYGVSPRSCSPTQLNSCLLTSTISTCLIELILLPAHSAEQRKIYWIQIVGKASTTQHVCG